MVINCDILTLNVMIYYGDRLLSHVLPCAKMKMTSCDVALRSKLCVQQEMDWLFRDVAFCSTSCLLRKVNRSFCGVALCITL